MLKYRLITGTLLVAALLVIVFVHNAFSSYLFLIVGALALTLSLREYFDMTAALGAPGYRRMSIAAGLAMIIATTPWVQTPGTRYPLHLLICIVFLFATFFLLFSETDFKLGMFNFMATTAGFAYLGWTVPCLARVYYHGKPEHSSGAYFFLFIILVTKCGDIGGYVLGNITARLPGGNHKMVPRLSPKKSWEGLVGSILFSAGAGWLLATLLKPHFMLDETNLLPPLTAAILGALLAIVGLIGDLAESVLKRASGFKDSGRILPGMGGILDVVDSLIFAGPLFYCYLRWISGVI